MHLKSSCGKKYSSKMITWWKNVIFCHWLQVLQLNRISIKLDRIWVDPSLALDFFSHFVVEKISKWRRKKSECQGRVTEKWWQSLCFVTSCLFVTIIDRFSKCPPYYPRRKPTAEFKMTYSCEVLEVWTSKFICKFIRSDSYLEKMTEPLSPSQYHLYQP